MLLVSKTARFATSISALYFEYPSVEGAHVWIDVLLQAALEMLPQETGQFKCTWPPTPMYLDLARSHSQRSDPHPHGGRVKL